MLSIHGSVSNLKQFEAQPTFRTTVHPANLHQEHVQVVRSRKGLTSTRDICHCSSLLFLRSARSRHTALCCIPELNKEEVLGRKLALILLFHSRGN